MPPAWIKEEFCWVNVNAWDCSTKNQEKKGEKGFMGKICPRFKA